MNPLQNAGINLPAVPNLTEWLAAGFGLYLFFNGHQVIGAAMAGWFGYQAIAGKPFVQFQVGGMSL